jgi:hypothetical protein
MIEIQVYDPFERLTPVVIEATVYGNYALHSGVTITDDWQIATFDDITTLTFVPLGGAIRQCPSRICAVNLLLRLRCVSESEFREALENKNSEAFNHIKSIILRWRADWNVPPENQ